MLHVKCAVISKDYLKVFKDSRKMSQPTVTKSVMQVRVFLCECRDD